LAQTGAELIITTLAGLKNGSITPRPQGEAHASLAPILKREDGLVDFSRTATDAWNRMRGFHPWPGAFSRFRGKVLQLHSGTPAPEVAVCAAGHFVIENDRLLLGFAHGTALDVQELQVEGKKRMSARDFINGYHPQSEETLGG
jgi:methionyl-tRNA formyltransferase